MVQFEGDQLMAHMVDSAMDPLAMPGGQPELGPFMGTMQHYPTWTASIGTMAFRGSNAIMHGGWRQTAGVFGAPRSTVAPTFFREAIAQNNPYRARNWMRYGTQDIFHGTGAIGVSQRLSGGGPMPGSSYTPFFGAAAVNYVGRGLMGGDDINRRAAGVLANLGERTGVSTRLRDMATLRGAGAEPIQTNADLTARGFGARVTAAARVQRMSDARFARSAAGTGEFLRGAGFGADQVTNIMNRGPQAARSALLTSGAGILSGRVGGFMAGAARGGMDPVVRQTLRETTRAGLQKGASPAAQQAAASARQARVGAATAGRWAGELGLRQGGQWTARQAISAGISQGGARALGRGAGLAAARVGLAASGVGAPILAAWLAYDVARLTTKGLGYAARGAINVSTDAFRSFTGELDRGFTDNEITLTNRARGVMAIQNSRLNARSVLGSEAGAMWSHFG